MVGRLFNALRFNCVCNGFNFVRVVSFVGVNVGVGVGVTRSKSWEKKVGPVVVAAEHLKQHEALGSCRR